MTEAVLKTRGMLGGRTAAALATLAFSPWRHQAKVWAAYALTAAGLAPQPPVSCAEVHRQGDGTYDVIGYGESGGEVHISTLGRFAADENDDPAVRGALESAGFPWIDPAVGSIEVTRLGVYYFGRCDPLDVHRLLFCWQD
ncbi:hypothetical protein [Streptomyces sp. NPDC054797]